MKFPFTKKFSKPVKIAIYAVVVLVIIAAIYFILDRAGYIRAFNLGMQLQQQEQQQNQDKLVLESLKKIILLPDDVEPTMAVINDVEALKKEQSAFFADAKNGDRVVVYPTLAIIYDYNANKIIHVGPVSMEQQPEDQGQTQEETSAVEEVPSEQ